MSEASIRPAIAELERAFTQLTVLFKREMPLPVITIQTRGRRRALGWYDHRRWHNGQADGVSEINLCAEYLRREVPDIIQVLLHEMIHYANALDGIEDCSRGQYHRKSFKARCDAVGLVCEKMGYRGWAKTSLGPELAETVTACGLDASVFSLFRTNRDQARGATRMKKWSCGCTTIRAAIEVDATCNRCKHRFFQCGG
jgi:hypothetical protein